MDWKGGHKERCAEIASFQAIRAQQIEQSTGPYSREQRKKIDREEPNFPLPSLATQAYIPKPLPQGEIVSGARQVSKVLQRMSDSLRRTADLVFLMCNTHTIMADKFDRLAKGLPPRPDDFMFNTSIDFHGNTTEEIVEEWGPLVNKFKTWMWRASDAALDFERHMPVPLSRVPQIASGVELMLEWKPTRESDWEYHAEGMVVSTLLAGCAHQKYYLERMLPPESPLHCYFTLLLSWVEWEGPIGHMWGEEVQLILSAILSGVELTQKSYHTTLDPALLTPLEPAYRKLVRVIGNDTRRLRPMEDIPSEATIGMTGVLNVVKIKFAGVALRELAACLRAKKIFPSLDLSPLRELCHYHQKEMERILRQIGNKYRAYLSDEIRVLATIVMG